MMKTLWIYLFTTPHISREIARKRLFSLIKSFAYIGTTPALFPTVSFVKCSQKQNFIWIVFPPDSSQDFRSGVLQNPRLCGVGVSIFRC